MADKCEFCGQSLVDGVCVNPECDLSDFAPAISDRADLSEDTFLPDLDLDDDLEMDLDEFLPETSKDSKSTGDSSEQPGDLVPPLRARKFRTRSPRRWIRAILLSVARLCPTSRKAALSRSFRIPVFGASRYFHLNRPRSRSTIQAPSCLRARWMAFFARKRKSMKMPRADGRR